MEMVQNFGSKVEMVLDDVSLMMGTLVGVAISVGDTLGQAGGFIADNWSIIAPLVYGVVTAMGLYTAALAVNSVIQGIHSVQKGIAAIAEYEHAKAILYNTAVYGAETVATATATVAQASFNTVLAACPLTWIILLVIALIAAIVAVCAYIAKSSEVATSAFGIMSGCVFVVGAAFTNLGLLAADVGIGIKNAMGACADNLAIAFRNAIRDVKSKLYSLLSSALFVVSGICEALNKLPFISFDYSGITSKATEYASEAFQLQGNKEQYVDVYSEFMDGMNTYDTFGNDWASDAFANGAQWGDSASQKLKDKISKIKDIFNVDDLPENKNDDNSSQWDDILGDTGLTDTNDIAGNVAGINNAVSDMGDIAANTGNTAADTARIADSIDITSEDLKYLRDIAEREIIDRTVFTKVEVNMGGVTNEVHDMADLDAIADKINGVLQEQIVISAEG